MLKSYVEFLNEALDEAMQRDSRVFLAGEDVGEYGGCFGASRGLLGKYGASRVVDTPMSEQTIVGLGTGAAIGGLRPVVEIMFMDFMTLAYDQLFNHASTFSYMSGGRTSVPLVLRVPAGGGRGYGATHSKTLVAPLMHIPGIKIVAPSDPREVKGLFNESLGDNNPVIFVEHKLLYGMKAEAEGIPDRVPLGKARIVREGRDLLMITFSKSVFDCLAVADTLAAEGVSCEVVDLRTIKPLDMETLQACVEKIGKVLVVEEGHHDCGVAAEIIARINESCFFSLQAPMKRVTTRDIPIPCCQEFESATLPSVERIEEAARGLLDE